MPTFIIGKNDSGYNLYLPDALPLSKGDVVNCLRQLSYSGTEQETVLALLESNGSYQVSATGYHPLDRYDDPMYDPIVENKTCCVYCGKPTKRLPGDDTPFCAKRCYSIPEGGKPRTVPTHDRTFPTLKHPKEYVPEPKTETILKISDGYFYVNDALVSKVTNLGRQALRRHLKARGFNQREVAKLIRGAA
jgi:hypothetical protein